MGEKVQCSAVVRQEWQGWVMEFFNFGHHMSGGWMLHPAAQPRHASDMAMKRSRSNGNSYAGSVASASDADDEKSRQFIGADNDEEDELTMQQRQKSSSGTSNSGLKRQRVHFSCTECHRRKQKCNRETPCQHCIARKIPERCKTFQPGEDPNDLGTRVSRLERSVADNFERLFSMMEQQAHGRGVSASNPKQRVIVDVRAPNVPSNLAARLAQSGASSTTGEASEEDDDIVPLAKSAGEKQSDQPITMQVNELITHSMEDASQGAPNPNDLAFTHNRSLESAAPLDVVLAEYGAPPGISQMLIAALPPKEHVDALLEHFFQHINWLRMPLSRKRFGARIDVFWKSAPALTAELLNLYATLMFTAAIATTTHRGPAARQSLDELRALRLSARKIFFAGRLALLYSVMLGREDVEQVLAFHTAARYLFLDRRISEAWTCVANAIKAAHSIGLHRDGSHFKLSDADNEARRRIWSYVYSSDRMLCMNLGRPTAVDDDVVDTQLPSDEDKTGEFADYTRPTPGVPMPSGEKPRFLSVIRIRHHLAVIMGRVMSTYQNLHRPAHYSDVVAIDNELMNLHKTLPDHLRTEFSPDGTIKHTNTRWDQVFPFVLVHRYLMQAEMLFVRMSLHRPYLFRANSRVGRKNTGTSSRFSFSRRACVESAHFTLELRRDLRQKICPEPAKSEANDLPLYTAHLGSYNVLHAIVIMGIALLQDPFGEFADGRLALLKGYLEFWQVRKSTTDFRFDETKQRDMVILQIFLDRIDAVRRDKSKNGAHAKGESASSSSSNDTTQPGPSRLHSSRFTESPQRSMPLSKEEDTAGVLLDLNQSATRPKKGDPAASRDPKQQGQTDDAQEKARADSINEDMMTVWPYLPTRMPHHKSAQGGNNGKSHGVGASGSNADSYTESSPYGAQSSHSNGESTPPGQTNSGRGGSGSEDLSAANVHQLFDSWFRYNAFETMEFDGMSSSMGGLAPPPLANAMLGQSSDSFTSGGAPGPAQMSGFGTENITSWAGNGAQIDPQSGVQTGRPHSRQASRNHPPQQNIRPGQAEWSAMPPSGWPLPLNGSNEGQPLPSSAGMPMPDAAGTSNDFGSYANLMGVADGALGGAGSMSMRGPGQTGADAGSASDQSQQAANASYDPMFWQSLIDKISG